MNTEKKVYEEPTVKMVEFDFSDRIAASGCALSSWNMTGPECITQGNS